MQLLLMIAVLATASPHIPDPCKLLTAAEASELLGAKLSPGEIKRMGVVTRCAFRGTADQEVFLDVHNETAPESDASIFDGMTHLPDVQPVSGIGDKALWSHDKFGSKLFIMKGGKLVIVGVPSTVSALTPAVEKAGKLIASRM